MFNVSDANEIRSTEGPFCRVEFHLLDGEISASSRKRSGGEIRWRVVERGGVLRCSMVRVRSTTTGNLLLFGVSLELVVSSGEGWVRE